MKVVVLSRLDTAASSGTLRPALEIIAKDPAPVAGVGGEAYSYLGGMGSALRKGKASYRMMRGINTANGQWFLTGGRHAERGASHSWGVHGCSGHISRWRSSAK